MLYNLVGNWWIYGPKSIKYQLIYDDLYNLYTKRMIVIILKSKLKSKMLSKCYTIWLEIGVYMDLQSIKYQLIYDSLYILYAKRMIIFVLKPELISILIFACHKGYKIRNQVYTQKNLNVMLSNILPINTNNLY